MFKRNNCSLEAKNNQKPPCHEVVTPSAPLLKHGAPNDGSWPRMCLWGDSEEAAAWHHVAI